MRFRNCVYSLMVLGVLAPLVQAGSMDLNVTPVDRLDPVTFASLPFVLGPDGRVADGQPGLYVMRIDFTAVKDPATEKGWLNTLFSATTSGSGLTLFPGSYDANIGTTDINGALPGGITNVYGTNQDAGVDNTDLQNILASLAGANITPTPNDRRNDLGTPTAPASVGFPSHIGNYLVEWDGLGDAEANLVNHAFSFSLLTNQPGLAQQGEGASFGFGTLAPPNTPPVAIDGLLLGQNANEPGEPETKIHQFTALDLEDPSAALVWSNLQFISYTPILPSTDPNPPNDPLLAATMDAAGLFTWVSEGSARGDYVWQATVTDTGGLADIATLRIEVPFVPEPTTFTMLGLAIVGGLGLVRRRAK